MISINRAEAEIGVTRTHEGLGWETENLDTDMMVAKSVTKRIVICCYVNYTVLNNMLPCF